MKAKLNSVALWLRRKLNPIRWLGYVRPNELGDVPVITTEGDVVTVYRDAPVSFTNHPPENSRMLAIYESMDEYRVFEDDADYRAHSEENDSADFFLAVGKTPF